MSSSPRLLALRCDRSGMVLDLLRDDWQVIHPGALGSSFRLLVDSASRSKADAFLSAVTTTGAASQWELTLTLDQQLSSTYFWGARMERDIVIIASPARSGLDHFCREVQQEDPALADAVRAAMRQRNTEAQPGGQMVEDSRLFDELTRLSNELFTAQRQLAKSNAELAMLNDEKNRILGMAAHDLRNHLGYVQGYAELLIEDRDLPPDVHDDILNRIVESSRFMTRMVHVFLDYSKIEAGRLELNRRLTDVSSLLEIVLERNRSLAQAKGMNLELRLEGEPPTIYVDLDRMEQVMTNLVTNAIKFSKPGTTVTLQGAEGGGMARLSVADQGLGIAPENLPELFRPFSTAGTKATGGESSTGLGLVIAKKIVKAHGGDLTVQSRLGEGSTFTLHLPPAPPSALAEEEDD